MYGIFLQIVAVFLMISAGYLAQRKGILDDRGTAQLAWLLMKLFYPCLIFSSIVQKFTLRELAANWTLPAGSFLIMLTGWAMGLLARRFVRHASPPFQRSFHFQCTMNNYSFLPIMMVAGLLGDQAVAQVAFASLGAEIMTWTLGVQVLTGRWFSRTTLRDLCSMPMLALLSAILVLTGLHCLPPPDSSQAPSAGTATGQMLLHTARMIGQATIPVSAIICGARMATLHSKHLCTRPVLGLTVLRLVLIPLAAIALLKLLPLTSAVWPVLLIISIQPCSMTSVSLTKIYKTDEHLAAATVLITHLACLLTIPLWWQVAGSHAP
jgi:predicted permease